MIELLPIKRTDPLILERMAIHYSHPKGFVGRNKCYAVLYGDNFYGCIVGGSAVGHLPGRDEWAKRMWLKNYHREEIVNNIFFNISGPYPIRNFGQKVLAAFRKKIIVDWEFDYGNKVRAFETLVELPRTGEVYRRDGWQIVGQTKGFTCKREGGKGTDSWSGKRVWNTTELRPKLVLMRLR